MRKKIFLSILGITLCSMALLSIIAVGLLFGFTENTELSPVKASALLFVGVLIIAIIVMNAAYLIAYKLVRPISFIAIGADDDKLAKDYPELEPIICHIHNQAKEIAKQFARVEKEKNRLATIINNMDEGLIILDNDLNITMINNSAYSWLGASVPRKDAVGMPIRAVCQSREICDCIERADHVNLTIDGRHLQLHVNHVVSNDMQVGRIGLLLDVTQRTEIDRIKQEFTANVSHELKTPLTSISGYAELIESGMAKGDDSLVFAGRIRKESTRMLALISDILKLSKLDESSHSENSEPVDLYRLAMECRDMLEINAEKHGVTVNVSGKPAVVLGAPGELAELVYNLIDNAIRYNRREGEVNVTVTDIDSKDASVCAVLTVKDTGIGISREHQSRVFERFYRVDKSRSKETGGTGLGLAIVKHVAERHNAKLELTSSEGVGTCITVTFSKRS